MARPLSEKQRENLSYGRRIAAAVDAGDDAEADRLRAELRDKRAGADSGGGSAPAPSRRGRGGASARPRVTDGSYDDDQPRRGRGTAEAPSRRGQGNDDPDHDEELDEEEGPAGRAGQRDPWYFRFFS